MKNFNIKGIQVIRQKHSNLVIFFAHTLALFTFWYGKELRNWAWKKEDILYYILSWFIQYIIQTYPHIQIFYKIRLSLPYITHAKHPVH